MANNNSTPQFTLLRLLICATDWTGGMRPIEHQHHQGIQLTKRRRVQYCSILNYSFYASIHFIWTLLHSTIETIWQYSSIIFLATLDAI